MQILSKPKPASSALLIFTVRRSRRKQPVETIPILTSKTWVGGKQIQRPSRDHSRSYSQHPFRPQHLYQQKLQQIQPQHVPSTPRQDRYGLKQQKQSLSHKQHFRPHIHLSQLLPKRKQNQCPLSSPTRPSPHPPPANAPQIASRSPPRDLPLPSQLLGPSPTTGPCPQYRAPHPPHPPPRKTYPPTQNLKPVRTRQETGYTPQSHNSSMP